MNKESVLYGIIGLLVGVIIGYVATNSINRSVPVIPEAAAVGGAAQLPADHPPTGPATGSEAPATDGMQGEVAATLERAKAAPADFAAQMKAGGLYYQIKRYDQALEYFQRAQKVKPNDFDVLSSLGNVSFDLERFSEAVKWYEQAVKLRPNDVDVRTDLGLSYYLGQPRNLDQAIASYRISLSHNPRHEKTIQNLITALIDKGDAASARSYLAQLEQANPNNQALPQFRAKLNSP
ncbi:MAG: tetratricopeptide repeat protein [Acidobacteriota bacterium]